MCMNRFKQWIKNWRKEWIDCDIPELRKHKENAKLMAWSFFANALLFAYLSYHSFNLGLKTFGISFLILTVYFVLLGGDVSNDRNRINMWIYLKENNKK